jgi:4-amino-4-deoxy-L-arabinose transferase-like glycosyltransferase
VPWGLLLFAVCIYLAIQISVVGVADIGGSSEAREAHVISEIVKNNDWVLPRRNGIIPSKPPLFHWIGAVVSSAIGGVSELSARAPSVLAGIFVVLCTGLCACRLNSLISLPSRLVKPDHAFFIAAGVLSLTYGFYQMTCQAMVDMVFCACVWGALTSLVCSDSELWSARRRLSPWSLTGFWFFCALSALARGPAGPVLCIALAGVGAWCAVGFKQAVVTVLRPTCAWLLLAIPVLWYLCAYEKGGEAFLERQLFFENVKRLTGGEHINEEAWWFYGPSLLRTTFPWGVLALGGGAFQVFQRRRVSGHARERVVIALPLALMAAGVALFSVASGKRHSYLVPLMPLVAVELALLLSVIIDRQPQRTHARFLVSCRRVRFVACASAFVLFLSATLLMAGAFDVGALTGRVRHELLALMLPLGVALSLGLMAAKLVPAHGATRVVFTSWAALFSLIAVVVASGSSFKARFKDFRSIAAQIHEYNTAGRPLVVIKRNNYEEYFDPILYYLASPVRVVALSSGGFTCNSSEVYFTESSRVSELAVQAGQQIAVIGVLREGTEHDLGLSGAVQKAKHEIAVFRCHESGSSLGREGAQGLLFAS